MSRSLLLTGRSVHRPFSTTRSLPLTRTHPFSLQTSWHGRQIDEHAVNRTEEKDVQSSQSQAGMREKERHMSGSQEAGKEDPGSQGVTEKDARDSNKRAKEEISPKAPGPVIGMNDERGGKGH